MGDLNAMRGWICALALAGCALAAGAAFAEEKGEPAAGFGYALAHDLMSPFCPGRTLAQCPSPQADALRVWILAQEAAGATREEVEAELVARYGEELRLAPPAAGLGGAAAYGVPILAVIVGGPVAFVALRRLVGRSGPDDRPPSGASAPKPPALDADVAAQLERELAERTS